MNNYDLIVIGAGSGGVRAARIEADRGAKVAICEKSRVGGTCVIRGCIPKKLLVYASNFKYAFQDAMDYGWNSNNIEHNWLKLLKAKNKELDRLEEIYNNLLVQSGVKVFEGHAEIISKNEVKINNRILSSKYIIIATGGYPKNLDFDKNNFSINSDEALNLKNLPKKIVIVGGGYIALEFACIYSLLGSKVTIIYRGEQVLRGFDDDLVKNLLESLKKINVDIKTNTNVLKIEKKLTSYEVTLSDDNKINTNQVLSAIGRNPTTENMGIDRVGILLDKNNAIVVDEKFATNIKNIFAIGDVTNRVNLTPVAIAEGHTLSENLFGNNNRIMDYNNVGTAVFSTPALCSIGPTEKEALKIYGKIDVYETKFKPLKYSITTRECYNYIKIIVQRPSSRILAAHMLGDEAPEIIQAIAIAITSKATKDDLDKTMAIHPTVAEDIVTLMNLYRRY